MQKSMHIFDAMRYVTNNVGKGIAHVTWKKNVYVVCTPSGNFIQVTPDGEYVFDWLKKTNPKMGWIKYDE